jgi:hypothetical protein
MQARPASREGKRPRWSGSRRMRRRSFMPPFRAVRTLANQV